MWKTLTWRALHDPEIADAVDDLRNDTLRFLLGITAVGYGAWHIQRILAESSFGAPATVLRLWVIAVLMCATLGLSYHLLDRSGHGAATCFVCGLAAVLLSSMWLLDSTTPLVALPVLVLAAITLVNPICGMLVAVVVPLAALVGQAIHPLHGLDAAWIWETSVVALAAVGAAWALGRNMVIAVEWSLASYEQAASNAEAARRHRAELVRALRQLDVAYYRLERANAALELAWKAAERAERARAEFVTNISHELRTPLNLIAGFSEMILVSPETYKARLPAAYRGDLNAIYRSAQHLLNLTNDVIDLARVGIGRLSLTREPADLGQVVAEACGIVREYVTAKRLSLDVRLAPGLPTLSLDPVRVRQVLLNLLTNAARFTEQGGITVSTELRDAHVVVRVSDTGHGIAQDELARVFEEFHHDGGEAGAGGVGLGLPISRRLVEMHGGEMGVESTLAVGTTFWFTLPLASVDGVAHDDQWRPPFAPHAVSSERVLVFAGPVELARLFQRHLRNVRVVAAPTLRRAAAVAVEFRALAILTDLEAEGSEEEAPVPIIRLPLPHNDRVAPALGADAFLLKPITRSELYAAIRRLERPVRSVLIADDDPRFLRLLSRVLQAEPRVGAQYEIRAVPNGREALTAMQARRPDLVLLDLGMPEMGGAEVLAAMRAEPSLREIPAILISAQDPLNGRLPLFGAVSIDRSDGFHLEELLGLVEATVPALDPPRRYLNGGDLSQETVASASIRSV
jgi:signal transduction histidine kinase/CheY-like chemotaxis protein